VQVIINRVISLNGKNNSSGNTLYLKNIENVMLRVSGALKYDIRATSCEI